MHHILIVDDDAHIREVVAYALNKAGYQVSSAADGAKALAMADSMQPDLIVLDVGLPERDGLDVCREIRRSSSVPILFLSARDEEIDRIVGLEIGGDDYVSKPFSPRELTARIAAILRRGVQDLGPPETDAPLQHGDLKLDPAHFSVEFAGRPARLTALEFAILRALLARPGILMTRDQIAASAYPGMTHVEHRTIDSHIRNIRAKLSAKGCHDCILTIHGVGFKLGPCTTAA